MMGDTTLVVGATGATGRLLVEQLLARGRGVKAVVRPASRLPDHLMGHDRLTVISCNLLELDGAELGQLVEGCDSIASCLGHNLTFKGLFGKPRRLVTDAVRRLCQAVLDSQPERPVRFVLMNTTGNTNRDLAEKVPLSQRVVIGILRVLLPPHVDNEQAADHLRVQVGQNHTCLEWVAVRPDALIDEDRVSEYQIHPSPIRNPIFNAGKTSRIHVAHFMSELIAHDALWEQWKGRMPVIYNQE